MSTSKYWEKTKELRKSLPNIMKKSIIGELNEEDDKLTMSEAINQGLLKYKEFKILYKKTGIKPCYFAYVIILILIVIFIGFFERYLTLAIATIYPLYISYKTLQYKPGDKKPDNMGIYTKADKQKDVTQWLSYWVVYAVIVNFEGLFSFAIKYIPYYFFFKVIFLLLCLLPQYQLATWIYDNLIGHLFVKYEDRVYNLSKYLLNAVKVAEAQNSQSKHKKNDDYYEDDDNNNKEEEDKDKNEFGNLMAEGAAENDGDKLDGSALDEEEDENAGIKED